MIQTLLICLNLNLIQTSTCYNSCCSISGARDPLCILDHMRHPIGIIHTPFSCWHAIHLEFINVVVKIPYRWIFTVDSLEFTFHRSLSSTSTPLHFKAFCFCFVAKTLVSVLSFFCLTCVVIAYSSSFVAIDFLRVWRIELTGRESEELHRMEKASYTLTIPQPIFSIYACSQIITLCMCRTIY